MTSPVDLRPDHLEIVQGILRKHLPTGVRVWVFGSRANWTTKDSSDLDLALEGQSKLSRKLLGSMKDAFEDSALPYTVDVVDMNRIEGNFRQIVELQRTPLNVDRDEAGGRDRAATSLANGPTIGEATLTLDSGRWREVTLGEFAPFSYGKSLPLRKRNPLGRVPVVGSGGIVGYHDSALTEGPTIVVGRKGTVGSVHYMRGPCWPIDTTFYVTGDDVALVRFTYYALKALGLNQMNSDSAVPGLNRNAAHARELLVPDESEQRAIARILGTLDDKIELNRRMNETLEAMARALFKSWFVNFEPVRAKMKGRWRKGESLPGLPAEHYDLFPDRMVDSDLGEIPEGWEVKELGEVATQRRNGVKPKEMYPDLPYIALEHMPKACIALAEWGRADGLASGKFAFMRGDILFGKLRPYFHKVGVAPVDGVCSTDIVVVSPEPPQWFGLVLGHASSKEFVDYTDATSTGTRMPRTKWEDMARYKIAVPSSQAAMTFNNVVGPWIDRMVSTIHECHALAAQRDSLLPKLVSGQVWIR